MPRNGVYRSMKIADFMEENHIAIYAKVNLKSKNFEVRKNQIELASEDLFEQLILYSNVETLRRCVGGQLLPRIWTQGCTKCVMCRPDIEHIVALFYDTQLSVEDNYIYAKQLESQVKDLFMREGK